MLDFARRRKPEAPTNGPGRPRLMWTILAPGLAIIVLGQVGLQVAQWGETGAATGLADLGQWASWSDPIDTRLLAREDSATSATFTSPAEESPAPSVPRAPEKRFFRGVKPSYLDAIRDDEPFRAAEADAWFHLLDILERSKVQDLKAHSRGYVAFVQLYRQSPEYRGELVTVRGRMVRAHRLRAPKNDYGFTHYYQTWLQPRDNLTNPMVIYVLHLPDGFPTGMEISEEVEVTGFFFKRWAYLAKDTIRSAPVVLAKTVQWHKPAPSPVPSPYALYQMLWAVLSAMILVVLAVVYMYHRPGRTPARRRFGAVEQPAPSPEQIAESLKRLAETEHTGKAPAPDPEPPGASLPWTP